MENKNVALEPQRKTHLTLLIVWRSRTDKRQTYTIQVCILVDGESGCWPINVSWPESKDSVQSIKWFILAWRHSPESQPKTKQCTKLDQSNLKPAGRSWTPEAPEMWWGNRSVSRYWRSNGKKPKAVSLLLFLRRKSFPVQHDFA